MAVTSDPTFSVRLPAALLSQIDADASSQRVSRTEWLRNAAEVHLANAHLRNAPSTVPTANRSARQAEAIAEAVGAPPRSQGPRRDALAAARKTHVPASTSVDPIPPNVHQKPGCTHSALFVTDGRCRGCFPT